LQQNITLKLKGNDVENGMYKPKDKRRKCYRERETAEVNKYNTVSEDGNKSN